MTTYDSRDERRKGPRYPTPTACPFGCGNQGSPMRLSQHLRFTCPVARPDRSPGADPA